MEPWIVTAAVVIGGSLLLLIGIGVLVAKFYRKVNQGQALIVNKMQKEPIVTFTGATVLPIIHRAEVMEISLKTIELERRGKEGLICKDNIRADIKVTFFVRVNKTAEDVLKVAQAIGCARASDQHTLEELFMAKFSEALKTVGKQLEFVELYEKRDVFKDEIIKVIGMDLNGYVLEDAAIDFLEQTPLETLDPQNILDAQGIKKITELTAAQAILTNDFKQQERKELKRQNVEAAETILELERQEADAEAKQRREIATMKAREEAETLRVQAEEKSRAELARIKAEEEIQVNHENMTRQVEVAQKNRERVVAIEAERVDKDRALEVIARERETELNRIAKEKEVEVQKKEIADVIRSRIAVDRTVAEEEEAIKDLRATAGARREKDVLVISAEAQAREKVVKDIAEAEASEEAAKYSIREQMARAEAELAVADRHAQAKIRAAEGVQAEVAAEGLAKVRVKEADAAATEKVGQAEARVTLQKMEAVAQGEERQGLARVAVRQAEAEAIHKEGTAEAAVARERGKADAEVIHEKHMAEAAGRKQRGLADVHVREADAAAVEKKGLAEAAAVRSKLEAEAAGLAEKAEAMKALDGVGREHEEFRLRLEKDKAVELEALSMRKDVAVQQAHVLREAFGTASINIVGGDGQFFDRFIRAVSVGQTLDGAIDHSHTLRTALAGYLDGERSLPGDLKDILSRPALDADGVQKLTIAAVLGSLMTGADGGNKKKLGALLERAKELGLDDLSLQ